MTKANLDWNIVADGCDGKLWRSSHLFRSRRTIPVSEWHDYTSGYKGLEYLIQLCESGYARKIDESTVRLTHAQAVELSASTAEALALPPLTDLTLSLSNDGTFDEAGFAISTTWHRFSQRRPDIERIGAFLKQGTRYYRLSNPLYRLLEAVDAFNASETSSLLQRSEAWQPVQEVLREITGENVLARGLLETLHIYQAGAVGVTFEEDALPAEAEAKPVLFTRQREFGDPEGIHEHPEQGGKTPDTVPLLPPELADTFASVTFKKSGDAKSTYVLGDGQYVVVEPEARVLLQRLKQYEHDTPEDRERFRSNPAAAFQSALAESFPDEETDGSAERHVVDLGDLSPRVYGRGQWIPPAIPWLVSNSQNDWLPERFGIRIGDRTIEIPQNKLHEVINAVNAALGAGTSTAQTSVGPLPANADVLKTLKRLQVTRPEQPVEKEPRPEPAPSSSPKDSFLIYQNLEADEFAAEVTPRRCEIDTAFPADYMRSDPKEHQRKGFEWLLSAWLWGRPGVLLADDMGLGKTFQVLSFIAWLDKQQDAMEASRRSRRKPILVVAPTALLKTWEDEHDRHLKPPGLGQPLRLYGRYGGTSAAADIAEKLAVSNWALTTYETLNRREESFLRALFSCVIFDEIQKIKSPKTFVTKTAKAVNADFVIGLTGTPVENSMADLWCILDRIEPALFGSLKSFMERYPATDINALTGLSNRLREPETRQSRERQTTLPPIMLRRMKDELGHVSLPEKRIEKHPRTMPDKQADAYETVVQSGRDQAAAGGMLQTLHALRGRSLHPYRPEQAFLVSCQDFSDYVEHSARLKAALEVLETIRARGEKALIFLEDRQMQTFLQAGLRQRFRLENLPGLISGETPGPTRQKIVTGFQERQEGFDVLILSPKAAGVGLTITAANHVLHLSRWWNPAVEDQCNDRVYRIGQTKPVTVHHFIAEHPAYADRSFDHIVDALLEQKRELARSVLAPNSDGREAGTIWTGIYGRGSTQKGETPGWNLRDLQRLTGEQFEQWCAERLSRIGYSVSHTPKTGDYGADLLAEHTKSGGRMVVECKQWNTQSAIDVGTVEKLHRARSHYKGYESATALLISTTDRIQPRAQDFAESHNIECVLGDRVMSWGSGDAEI